jgi:hypothetical protein
MAQMIAVIGVFVILSGLLLQKFWDGWTIGAFLICWLSGAAALTQRELECPACHGNILSRQLGAFCPECGAANLRPGSRFACPHCDACGKTLQRGKTLARGKTRRYRIHACTHCGLMLDGKGL